MSGEEFSNADQAKEGNFAVCLKSCGNFDRGQNPYASLGGVKPDVVMVKTLAQASKMCSEYIAKNALGSGNWAGGDVWLDDILVARVSYNGRVWGLEPQNAKASIGVKPRKLASPK